MTENKKHILIYAICGIFIALNAVATYMEFYLFNIVPVVLLLILLAFLSLDKLLLLTVFFTPLAINIDDIGLGVGISLPTEPLLVGIMCLFFLKLFTVGKFDKEVTRHPISIAIIINLVWILITSITSTEIAVSLKFFISRLWFVVCFYFLATQLFKNIKNIRRFFWCYIIPLFIVIGYTIFNHAEHGFEQKPGHWVMTPFYNDHTSYGAVIAMFIPFLVAFTFNKLQSGNLRRFTAFMLICFLLAIVLSYTRAAWVSLIGVLVIYIIIHIRIKLKGFLIITVACLAVLFVFRNTIYENFESNTQDSATDFRDHIKSISNISTDASNLERINRWNSALRMFQEKPFLGWGPGTYMFKYAPFQHSSEKTIISTNAGDMGNAHSEYIGPLAESGVLGSLSYIIIIIITCFYSIKIIYRNKDPLIQNMAIVIFLGLCTYFIHGILNNFLDTDKASVPFWGFIAMITTLDIYHNKKEKELKEKD